MTTKNSMSLPCSERDPTTAASTNTTTTSSTTAGRPAEVMILDWTEVMAAPSSPETTTATITTDYVPNDGGRGGQGVAWILEQALGPGGIGLVAIRNVPHFVEAKQVFLPQAHALATRLPPEYLEQHLTKPEALYNVGWSHGKEKLVSRSVVEGGGGGRRCSPDYGKGSFYYNPLTDTPGTDEERRTYPLSYLTNVWPDDDYDHLLPGFQSKAKRLGTILTEVVIELSKHIDALAQQKVPNYPPLLLYNSLKHSEKSKARLLYYFPLEQQQTNPDIPQQEALVEDSWIGWHNDSGFLTALAGDLYVDHDTGYCVPNPDPHAGLYVLDRNQVCHRLELPPDCVMVQIGECTQIVTGGIVAATPHCVRGIQLPTMTVTTTLSDAGNVARISMACFVDTPPQFPLRVPLGSSRSAVLAAGASGSASSSSCKDNDDDDRSWGLRQRVPPLDDRWISDGMTFGDFLQRTFSAYYE